MLLIKKANDNIDLLNLDTVLAVVDFTSQITLCFCYGTQAVSRPFLVPYF